jgi:hypothetical protein
MTCAARNPSAAMTFATQSALDNPLQIGLNMLSKTLIADVMVRNPGYGKM